MRRAVRYLVTFGPAAAVTFGLFWVMQALIGVDAELREAGERALLEFIRLERESEPETRKRELPDKVEPEEEPPPPDVDLARTPRPDVVGGGLVPSFGGGAELDTGSDLGIGVADQDAVPLVRVNPQYPMRAAQRGIEGWVEVEFTISRTGSVEDARVIAYHPSSIFNDAALRAIRRWRYNPRVEEGRTVEQPGIVVRLTFQLEE